MSKPLRFCMVTTFYPPFNFGGDGIFVHRLSNELAARGHRVEVIHCADSYRLLAGRDPAGDYRDHPNVSVHTLRSAAGPLSPLLTQQTGRPLFKAGRIKEILSRGFDVIQFHNISLVGGPKILEYGRGVKLYAIHEHWLICPTHVLFKFNREACRKRNCFLCTLSYRRPPQLWRYTAMIERAVRNVDAFIAPCAFIRDKHREMGLDIPVVQIPFFIPEKPAEAPDQGSDGSPEDERKPFFLFVGRLEKLKGLQTLIPLFRRYDKARLLVAGEGTYGDHLRKMARGCKNIRFLGRVGGDRLWSLYRNARALIVPSLCYETMTLVTVEAFREGTPAIVRRIGGMPELISESGGGYIFETEVELLAAMDRLVEDPDHRDELGRRGHEAFLRRYKPDIFLRNYLELIERLAAGKGPFEKDPPGTASG
jgi:glycosyltransferase involved in cell wall biosynthesis